MKYAILFFSLLISLSCSNKPKETAAATEQPFTLADRAYIEKAEAAMHAWANGDFDTWATFFTDEAEFNYPRGPRDMPFQTSITDIKEEAQWYKNWFKVREVTKVAYNPLSSIAILAKEDEPFYGNKGVSVISIATMEISIYGAPIKAGTCYIHHFNEDGLIDKSYFIQDLQNQMEALNY